MFLQDKLPSVMRVYSTEGLTDKQHRAEKIFYVMFGVYPRQEK